jgi:mannose-6-phosphate isomerase
MQKSIFKIKGKVQPYAWGGKSFIANLLHLQNNSQQPMAEYWMGAHPSAPSIIEGSDKNLLQLIQENSEVVLTKPINDAFGELPFLFKILDVNEMLSIQVHPTRTEAEKGFLHEEEIGIPLNAPHRNYKDKNHKPEVMIALGEFWLLHGFKSLHAIEETLSGIKEFNHLLSLFKAEGLKALYKFWMELPQAQVDTILLPIIQKEIFHKQENKLDKTMPGWWVTKYYPTANGLQNIDKGIFSIYLFNIVQVQKGQAIFQAAGVPHAYLEGQNVELMANSDNVLRGGLTPKHVDVPELLKHTIFEPVIPVVMDGSSSNLSLEKKYNCPVPDFKISSICTNQGNIYNYLSQSPEIIIVITGAVVVNSNDNNFTAKQGECFMVLPNTSYTITSSGFAELYKAYV